MSGTGAVITRHIQYAFTLQNSTSHLLKNVDFWANAPVKQTATQYCLDLKSSHPYELITDGTGNQVLHFIVDDLPPYAARIITIKARLLVSRKPDQLAKRGSDHAAPDDLRPYFAAEDLVESNNPDVIALANKLKADTPPAGAGMTRGDDKRERGMTRNLAQAAEKDAGRMRIVIPPEAGVLHSLKALDSRLRGNDRREGWEQTKKK